MFRQTNLDLPDMISDMIGVASIAVATVAMLWLPALAG